MNSTDLPGTPTEILDLQRRAYQADPNPALATRLDRLARLTAMTESCADAMAEAICADFGNRSRHETRMTEIFGVLATIKYTRRHLRHWMKPRRMPTAIYFRPGTSRILRQPLGVIGIVSPWNYPFMLSIGPAAAALAAGNRIMLKPSEIAPASAALMARSVAHYFSPEEFAVLPGDASLGRAFVSLPFDHLLFTGSTAVGRKVAQAAAANLTPVTLELGGKSPAILDDSCNLEQVAVKLVMGKLLNAGQSCIAPDYVLLGAGREEAFLAAFRSAVARLYPTLATNPDYSSIINDAHFKRLTGLLDDARARGARVVDINPGDESFPRAGRKMPPRVVLGVNADMALMQEEIFGPLLPVVSVPDVDSAIRYVNARPRPLALYWFGTDAGKRDRVLAETVAGGVTVNDTLWHLAQEALPFGGIGQSGQGAYHGEYGFLSFSKEKPVFEQSRWSGVGLFYPPYGKTFERLLALLKRIA